MLLDDLRRELPRSREVVFTHIRTPLLDPWSALTALEARARGFREASVSLDLWLSMSLALIEGDELVIEWSRETLSIDFDSLEEAAESTSVYALTRRGLEPVAMFSDASSMYCKLRFVAPFKPPTVEIGGIHMHRIEGCDPLQDAVAKVRCLGRKLRGAVLDTCLGLGYTAIAALSLGAELVVSIELDPAVIAIASFNPWSKPLALARSLGKAMVLLGDSSEVVREMPSDFFDYVIHDPPRFELAGELYSYEFYRELFRVMKPGAKLFHYTGEPRKHSGVSIVKGVKRRLEQAGFERVRWVEGAKGFVAIKPR